MRNLSKDGFFLRWNSTNLSSMTAAVVKKEKSGLIFFRKKQLSTFINYHLLLECYRLPIVPFQVSKSKVNTCRDLDPLWRFQTETKQWSSIVIRTRPLRTFKSYQITTGWIMQAISFSLADSGDHSTFALKTRSQHIWQFILYWKN